MGRDYARSDRETGRPGEASTAWLSVHPARVTLCLGMVVLFLTTIGTVSGFLTRESGGPFLQTTIRRLFDLNGEGNVPAWISASLLLLCSLLLVLSAGHARQTGARYHRHWAVLALLFLFLSVDESARLHEPISSALRTWLRTSGALVHAWVIPYGVLALAVAATYARFPIIEVATGLRPLPQVLPWLQQNRGVSA